MVQDQALNAQTERCLEARSLPFRSAPRICLVCQVGPQKKIWKTPNMYNMKKRLGLHLSANSSPEQLRMAEIAGHESTVGSVIMVD